MMHDAVIDEVKHWIEKVVIGLNFCPFAAKPFHLDKIIYPVHNEMDVSSFIKQFYAVVRELQEEPPEVVETAFIIYPNAFHAFDAYLQFLEILQSFLELNQLDEEFQLASFHPYYYFNGSDMADVTNQTNRSPYPLIHILRSESIYHARMAFGDTLKIPEANIDKLKTLGNVGWLSFCRENSISLPK
jgi:hypothetical protein